MPDSSCEKVFWQDPYCTRLRTHINTVDGDQVTLARTIFFASAGGQESDFGTIAGITVLEARKQGQQIYYTLPGDHALAAGQAVDVSIDWPRRYRLMRLHLAAEIVLELTLREFERIEKTGAHISADKARIDFAWPRSIADALPRIETRTLRLIEADREIVSAFSNAHAERRFWEIDGFARVPCGGTHLQRTGEIGALALRRRNPGKGRERVEITLREP